MEKRVSKLSLNAEDLEGRETLAKRLNRNAKNRLRQQQEQYEDNHDFIKGEINQEIKRLQDDLKGIREIGNYEASARNNSTHEMNYEDNNNSIKRKRKNKFTLIQKKPKGRSVTMRRLNRDEKDKKVKFHHGIERSPQLISVEKTTAGSNLFNLSRDEKQPKYTQTLIEHDVPFDQHEIQLREHRIRLDGHAAQLVEHETRHVGRRTRFTGHVEGHSGHARQIIENETRPNNHEPLPYITQSATLESKSRELDVHEARTQTRKRLLGENEVDSNTQAEQDNAIDEDIESYMYVPPDGRKRTVYLLPPLEELLQEARKARYLRIPKRLMTYEDDPERELSVDEIFRKSV